MNVPRIVKAKIENVIAVVVIFFDGNSSQPMRENDFERYPDLSKSSLADMIFTVYYILIEYFWLLIELLLQQEGYSAFLLVGEINEMRYPDLRSSLHLQEFFL